MNDTPPCTRRDTRFRLRPESSFAEFADPRVDGAIASGPIASVCAAGLALLVEGAKVDLPAGTCLENMTLRIGECILRGEAVVRNRRAAESGWYEIGCLFYPVAEDEDRWMTLLAGIAVAAAPGGGGE